MRNTLPQLIVGAEGSGKTALALGLAHRLQTTQNGPLAGFTVTLLTAEEMLQAPPSLDFVTAALDRAGSRSVLFIDDLDVATLVGGEIGTRKELLVGLRAAIERRDSHLILTMSQSYVAPLKRVYPEFFDELQLVEMDPITPEDLRRISVSQAAKLEWFHGVTIDAAAIDAACAPAAASDRQIGRASCRERV